MINRLLNKHKKKKAAGAKGFTLIELLVVITILGILAAVVIFAVSGIGDKGKAAAQSTDATILSTAEEAACAKNGAYTDVNGLKGLVNGQPTGTSFLASTPQYNGVVLTTTATGITGCGSYVVGPTTYSGTTGPNFLSASNNTAAWSFLAPSFIAQNNAIQFTFGASGANELTAATAGDQHSLYAGADGVNVLKLIQDSTYGGTCGTPAVGAPTTAACPGVGSSLVQYATGKLVVFSCRADGITLQPASGSSPQCKAGSGGYFGSNPTGAVTTSGANTAPVTPHDIVALLTTCTSCKLAVANPGGAAGSIPAAPYSAPYGGAAFQALTCTYSATVMATGDPGCGGLATTTGAPGGIDWPDLIAAGRIVEGSNVTTTQSLVEAGTVDMALLPQSFVVSPEGNDTNTWTTVTQANASAYALYSPITQWACTLSFGRNATDVATAQAWLTYITSAAGKLVMTAHGYV